MSETEQNTVKAFENHPELKGYILEMASTGRVPREWTKFLCCLAENLKPVRKTKETFEQRKKAFGETLKPHIDVYGRDMMLDFFGYWTEPTQSGTRFRQELEKTWDLTRRLKTWATNNKMTKKQISKNTEKPIIGRMSEESVINSLNNFR